MRSIDFQFQAMPFPGSVEGTAYPSARLIVDSVMTSSCGMCSSQAAFGSDSPIHLVDLDTGNLRHALRPG